jgi:mutator protein MutT
MKVIDVAIAIVSCEDRILICRRRQDGHLGGFWEFPGGKVEPGETPQQCAQREIREEVDLEIDVLSAMPVIEHEYPERNVRLHPFLCAYKSGHAKPLGCDEALWVAPANLMSYQFPQANNELIRQLVRMLPVPAVR